MLHSLYLLCVAVQKRACLFCSPTFFRLNPANTIGIIVWRVPKFLINPLTVGSDVWIDLSFMMVATIMVFAFALTGKIKRSHGLILISTYVIYVTILLLRAFNVIVL